MFAALSVLCLSRKPVILIPGTYASHLVMTANDVDLDWFCPKTFTEKTIWLNEEYGLPPLYNCLCQWLTVKYDPTNQNQTNLPGLQVHTQDFGGLDGINRVDQTVMNISFIPYYSDLVKMLEEKGYKERVDLFGAPNDWRFGIAGMGPFFNSLKGLVETAYAQNGNQKVVMIGHSFGGFCLQYFASTFVDNDWAQKYLDHVILVCPSFGGSGEAVDVAWTKTVRAFIPFQVKRLTQLIESAGAVHIHLPNFELYGDTPIIQGPDGKNYTAREVPDLLVAHGRITGDNINLLNLTIPFISRMPDPPRVPTHIVYNSLRSTVVGLVVEKSWDNNSPKQITAGGDGTILAAGLQKYCQNNSGSPLVCHDVQQSGKNGGHFYMLLDQSTLSYIDSIFE